MSVAARFMVFPGSLRRRPLRILAAARSLPLHAIGGMQAIAWDVLTGLAQRGHRVTVLTTTIPGRACVRFRADGVTVVPLEGTPPERYSSSWWKASARYARRYFADDVDAVLSVSSAAAGLLPLKGSALRAPFIFQAHGSSWAEALAKWRSWQPTEWLKSVRNFYWLVRDARIYRQFDEFVFVGDGLARQFTAPPLSWMTRGIPRATITNGIDTRRFRFDPVARARTRAEHGFAASDRVAVFAARLIPQKGAAEALRALATLRRAGEPFKLLIIGDGPEAATLRALAAEAGCGDAVGFTGAASRETLPQLLSAGDVFVFPALGEREGLPLNVLEALAIGLPCVCSDSLEPIFGAVSGITYVPTGDGAALAAAMRDVAATARRVRWTLPPEYSLDRCIDGYEALLRRLTAS